MYFLYYIVAGALFTLFIDLLCHHLKTNNTLTNREKLVIMILWPIALVIFIKEMFYQNNTKD
jgi:hypothetical protein|tara:strand:+ start:680 stop:865 length:186 start_codon:yes stop_codon:yes gene_type:complete